MNNSNFIKVIEPHTTDFNLEILEKEDCTIQPDLLDKTNQYKMNIGSKLMIPFKTGGCVDDGVAYLHRYEGSRLTEEQTKDWLNLVETVLPNVQKMMSITKDNIPKLEIGEDIENHLVD